MPILVRRELEYPSSHYTIHGESPSVLWDFTQGKKVVSNRRFGTTYRSHLEDGTDRLSRNVSKEQPFYAA